MKRSTARHVEELLRSGAAGARREPDRALRDRVRAAVDTGRGPSPVAYGATQGAMSAGRWKTATAAVAVLAAAGFWVVALAGIFGGGADGDIRTAVPSDDSAFASAGPPSLLQQVAVLAPRSLSSAIDAPLLAEIDRIGQDATRAARFLVGRLPSSLAAREGPDTSR